jgi:hypothetical protein
MNAGPVAITGSLVDLKNIAVHKCVRLSIDVPAELAQRVIASFGWPTGQNPVPVAIARIDTEAVEQRTIEGVVVEIPIQTPPPDRSAVPARGAEDGGSEGEEIGGGGCLHVSRPPPAPKRKWNELPPAQQAAIRCGEPEFWRFLASKGREPDPLSAEGADLALKELLCIDSKTRLNEWPSAWHSVEDEYWAWQRNPRRAA